MYYLIRELFVIFWLFWKKNVDESFTCFDIWTGNCPFHLYEHLQYKIVQISWCVYSIRCPWKKMCQRFMSAALRRRRAIRQMRWEHHHCGQCNVVVLIPALHGKQNFFLLLSTISSYVRCVLWARTCLLDVDWLMKADVMNQVSEYGEVKNLQCCWCQGPESSDLVYIHSLVAWALWMWAILFHVCYPWIKKKKKKKSNHLCLGGVFHTERKVKGWIDENHVKAGEQSKVSSNIAIMPSVFIIHDLIHIKLDNEN